MLINLIRTTYNTNNTEDTRRLKKYINTLHFRNNTDILNRIRNQIQTAPLVTTNERDIYQKVTRQNTTIVHPKYSFGREENPHTYTFVNEHFVALPKEERRAQSLVRSLVFPKSGYELDHQIQQLSLKVIQKIYPDHLAFTERELDWHPDSSIVISYRDEGNGSSAFYDHYTIQNITKKRTAINISKKEHIRDLQKHIRTKTHNLLQRGIPDPQALNRLIPKIIENNHDDEGLLILPGKSRDTATKRALAHQIREEREKELIRRAMLIGQPIIAICGGSIFLWQQLGGGIKNVHHHTARTMPRIKDSDGKIGWNIQMHRLKIEKNTLLSSIIGNNDNPAVNSVHWEAPDENQTPPFCQVNARALRDNAIAPSNIEAEENSVEGFETKFGAPILGMQWHPEAYNLGDSCYEKILKTAAKAGDAFKAKRRMLRELNFIFQNKN